MAFTPTQTAMTLTPARPYLTDLSAFYSVSGKPPIAIDSDAIGGDLYNVLSTLVGDECFEPTYGCDLPLRVFEPATPAMEMTCLNDVYIASRDWVPQANVSLPQSAVYADEGNRVVGIQVVYAYGGASWTLSTSLTQAFNGSV